MKKQEITKLVNSLILIRSLYNKLEIYNHRWFNERRSQLENIIEDFIPLDDKPQKRRKEDILYDVPEISEDLKIIRKDLTEIFKKAAEAYKCIDNHKCAHEIRLTQYGLGTTHKCIFCLDRVYGDDVINWDSSSYRNKYCVNLDAYSQPEYDSDLADGYVEEQVYDIILNIIKDKSEDEEIDLVKEFSKLNLKRCEVIMEEVKKESRVLVIGGTNKQFVDKVSYFTSYSSKVAQEIALYFSGILDVKVLLVDSKEQDKSDLNGYRDLRVVEYDDIHDIRRILAQYAKGAVFDLIVDVSHLCTYTVDNGKLAVKNERIEFDKLFPGVQVIKIDDFSKLSLSDIEDHMKSEDYNASYVYGNDNLYYNHGENVECVEKKEGFSRIRKEIKK